jgi:hypothetical protein
VGAEQVADDVVDWLHAAVDPRGDPRIDEMHTIMSTCAGNL